MYYRQCVLKKGDTTHVSWLPEKYAKHGKLLEIKVWLEEEFDDCGCVTVERKGEWSDGWIVEEVGEIRLTAGEVLAISKDYRYHRQRTDI